MAADNKAFKITAIVIVVILILVALWYFFIREKDIDTDTEEPEITPAKGGGVSSGGRKGSGSSAVYNLLPAGQLPLKRGDKNKLVYLLQYALNDMYGAGLSLDGSFGGATENAVMKYFNQPVVEKATAGKIISQYRKFLVDNKRSESVVDSFQKALGI